MDCIQNYRCTFHFIEKYKANCSDEHTNIEIIRHNHENDEKLNQHLSITVIYNMLKTSVNYRQLKLQE